MKADDVIFTMLALLFVLIICWFVAPIMECTLEGDPEQYFELDTMSMDVSEPIEHCSLKP